MKESQAILRTGYPLAEVLEVPCYSCASVLQLRKESFAALMGVGDPDSVPVLLCKRCFDEAMRTGRVEVQREQQP
jgi:hypothetical protein